MLTVSMEMTTDPGRTITPLTSASLPQQNAIFYSHNHQYCNAFSPAIKKSLCAVLWKLLVIHMFCLSFIWLNISTRSEMPIPSILCHQVVIQPHTLGKDVSARTNFLYKHFWSHRCNTAVWQIKTGKYISNKKFPLQ